jgi:hypothetical protein
MIGFFRACVKTIAPINRPTPGCIHRAKSSALARALKPRAQGSFSLSQIRSTRFGGTARLRPLGKITLHPCKLAGEDAGVEFQRLV